MHQTRSSQPGARETRISVRIKPAQKALRGYPESFLAISYTRRKS